MKEIVIGLTDQQRQSFCDRLGRADNEKPQDIAERVEIIGDSRFPVRLIIYMDGSEQKAIES